MAQYLILLPGDETAWQHASDEQRSGMYDRHREFMERLVERGHKVTGGAELTHSSEARVVRADGDTVSITEGPYAETVEQLTGFYSVETDDLDDLLQICALLADAGGGVEVRATVAPSS